MAFQTGVATSITDLWTKIKTFAVSSLGWTDRGTYGTDPVGSILQTPGNAYYGVGYNGIGATNNISLCLTSGYTADTPFSSQPNTSWLDPTFTTVGPMTFPTTAYWFFGEAEYLYFVVEDVPGQFWHGCIGTLNKTHTFSGGRFCCGTHDYYSGSYNTQIYSGTYRGNLVLDYFRTFPFYNNQVSSNRRGNAIHINGVSGVLSKFSVQSNYAVGSELRSGSYPVEYTRANNNFTGRTVLHPVWITAKGTWGGTEYQSIIGSAPNYANVNLKYIGGKGVLSIGSDDWYLFPIRKFNVSMSDVGAGELSSGLFGIGYKRVG